jgi:hypothetical protein
MIFDFGVMHHFAFPIQSDAPAIYASLHAFHPGKIPETPVRWIAEGLRLFPGVLEFL